jgi:hypothetical protein
VEWEGAALAARRGDGLLFSGYLVVGLRLAAIAKLEGQITCQSAKTLLNY